MECLAGGGEFESGICVDGAPGVQVLVLDDVTVSAGGRDLLTGASWRLLPSQRCGLVGVNGCGKSTLLRALVGNGDIQSGYVAMSLDTEVAYLEQTCVSLISLFANTNHKTIARIRTSRIARSACWRFCSLVSSTTDVACF